MRKRWEFVLIQGRGRRVATQKCALLLRCRADNSGARLGLTVSKKVGNAVARSRAKRVIREAFRATQDLWPPDVDLVVIARKATTTAKPADLIAEWRAAHGELTRKIAMARQDCATGKTDGQRKKGPS